MQRQTLRAVPVSEVKYEWKDTSTRFWVFGLDHKVYAPDYPNSAVVAAIYFRSTKEAKQLIFATSKL
ncbi:hypothetical protein OS493_000575 [Desmophyllum pertusum]|uniref:Uncharacterized protein n=1 Tax=Desmophyllum pertusum TaxID=174260 RepID=A0A9X0A8J0_9CNID|nr:hypothetical protein OS493_000575 [Desmophyllum pertusum]